ncbi:unnamed protein product [Didymodactylos carnosus]|uniref:Uncharacterized protein n=1 Tax=Didymodactylos carnosus TaxID=1234261 RepID=A0A8S2FJX0_9BILA|nr:unnamed protein product [Didymodactylos carnosus]CAF4276860.1 unnamed protein product [Didymodactylos carnosus]
MLILSKFSLGQLCSGSGLILSDTWCCPDQTRCGYYFNTCRSGLSMGSKVGIGVAIAFALLVFIVCLSWMRRKRRRQEQPVRIHYQSQNYQQQQQQQNYPDPPPPQLPNTFVIQEPPPPYPGRRND